MTLCVHMIQRLGDLTLEVDFDAPPGLTALFGRSGSGKTTVINAVAGLIRPQSARISLDGRVLQDSAARIWVPPHRRNLGYIFQEGRLFPHLTVRQNLAYGRWFAKAGGRRDDTDRVVEMLGIGALLDRRPALLSGGEKQRVAIGRALLAAPRLILADEPLAALDEARKAEILPYFERLRDEMAVPILYVSHSASEVARLATTVVALQDGRVARVGPAGEVFADPGFAPTGVRAMGAVLEARVTAHHADGLSELDANGAALFLPRVPLAVGASMRIRIAAHEVMLSRQRPDGISALNVLAAQVVAIRAGEGPGAVVSLETQAGRILARITQRSVAAMDLHETVACWAVVKSVAIAPEDAGGAPVLADP